MSGNRIVYAPTVQTNGNNTQEAIDQFHEIMKNAPKPGDHPGATVVVAPKLKIAGPVFSFSSVMKQSLSSQQVAESDKASTEEYSRKLGK